MTSFIGITIIRFVKRTTISRKSKYNRIEELKALRRFLAAEGFLNTTFVRLEK